MKKRLFIFLIIIIAGGVMMVAFFCRMNENKDLCAYIERILKIEWSDCIEVATGNVETRIGKDDYAYVKLEVKEGYEGTVLNIVRNRFGNPTDLSGFIMPGYQGHEFAEEIKNSNTQYVFETFMEGKEAKTRSIMIYVVYDENNRMYIYVMG